MEQLRNKLIKERTDYGKSYPQILAHIRAAHAGAFAIGFLWPFVWGVYLSFCRFTTVQNVSFVGLQNYANIWIDNTFTHAFFLYGGVYRRIGGPHQCVRVCPGLLLTRKLRGTNLFRTVFFMPNLIGGIVLGYIWKNAAGRRPGPARPSPAGSGRHRGFWGLIILMCWQQIGYMMVIYIAGLQNVPIDLIEAARVDGATDFQTLVRIKIPMVMSNITICLFLTLTNSFKLFDQNLSLTNGLPGKDSQMLALNIYDTFYARSGLSGRESARRKPLFSLSSWQPSP